MSRLSILVCVVALAAGSANCANAPGQANSVGDIGPSANMVAAATGAVSSTLAKGGNKGKPVVVADGNGMFTLEIVTDVNGDGASWGDSVTFNVSTTEQWNQISLVCSQGDVVVFGAVRSNTLLYPIGLSSAAWQSGAADCVATLDQFNGTKVNTLASLGFAAGA